MKIPLCSYEFVIHPLRAYRQTGFVKVRQQGGASNCEFIYLKNRIKN